MIEKIKLRSNQHNIYDTVKEDEVILSSDQFECRVKSYFSSNLLDANGQRCVNYFVSVSNYGNTELSLNIYCGIGANGATASRLIVSINNPIAPACFGGTRHMISITGIQPKAAYGMPYIGYGSYKSFDYEPVYKTSLSS